MPPQTLESFFLSEALGDLISEPNERVLLRVSEAPQVTVLGQDARVPARPHVFGTKSVRTSRSEERYEGDEHASHHERPVQHSRSPAGRASTTGLDERKATPPRPVWCNALLYGWLLRATARPWFLLLFQLSRPPPCNSVLLPAVCTGCAHSRTCYAAGSNGGKPAAVGTSEEEDLAHTKD